MKITASRASPSCAMFSGLLVAATMPPDFAQRPDDHLTDVVFTGAGATGETSQRLSPDEALKHLEEPLAKRDDDIAWHDAWFLAARASLMNGRYDRALRLLDEIDNHFSELSDVIWRMRAQAFRGLSRWAEARDAWEQLLKLRGALGKNTARYGIADAYLGMGKLREARKRYRVAIAWENDSERAMTARYALGHIAERLGQLATAASHYGTIAYQHPLHALSNAALRRIDVLAKQRSSLKPTFTQRMMRADRLLEAHAVDEAHAELKALTILAKTPKQQRSLKYRLGQLALRRRDCERAIDIFKSLVAATDAPLRSHYERWLARAHSVAGDYQGAVDVYLNRVNAARGSARRSLFLAAWFAYDGGDHKQAKTLLDRLKKSYKYSPPPDVLWLLGWNAYRLGDLDAAAGSLRRLRRRFPQSELVPRANYWEGRIAVRLGDFEAARKRYAAAENRDPHGYYAFMSRLRLTELERLDDLARSGLLLATLTNPSGRTRRGWAYDPLSARWDDALTRKRQVPTRPALFDWQSPTGRRVERLIELRLWQDAANLVLRLDALPGHNHRDVRYARAQLLTTLGDLPNAYRFALWAFQRELQDPVGDTNRRVFDLAYPAAYRELVLREAEQFKVSPLLILAVIRQESAFDSDALSWANAIGLMQISTPTGARIAAKLRVDDYHPARLGEATVNVRFGAWYLSRLLKTFRGHPVLAVASYNAGPVAVSRWLASRSNVATDEFVEEIPYDETRTYVQRVVRNLALYHKLYAHSPVEIPELVNETNLTTAGLLKSLF